MQEIRRVQDHTPFRSGFTAWGCHENGSYVIHRPSMAGEVNASFPGPRFNPETGRIDYDFELGYPEDNGESQVREWAERIFASDPVVHHVIAIVTEQKYQGLSWTQTGRGFRIDRPAA